MINAAVIGVSGFGATHVNDLFREHEAGRLNFAAAVIHHAWYDILPSFVGSMAVSALLRAVLGKARLTLEQWLGRRDGEMRPGGGGQRISCLLFRGPMEPRACAGV